MKLQVSDSLFLGSDRFRAAFANSCSHCLCLLFLDRLTNAKLSEAYWS